MHRDLARLELWEESLQRSRERRAERASAPVARAGRARHPGQPAGRVHRAATHPPEPPQRAAQRRPAVELSERSAVRELSDFDPWQRSLARSRARRDALSAAPGFEIAPGRASVAAAAVLLTGGSAVAVASGSLGDDPDPSAVTATEQVDATAKEAPARRAATPRRKPPAPHRKPNAVEPATVEIQRPSRPLGTATVDGAIMATPAAQRALRPPPKPRKLKTTAKRKTKAVAASKPRRGGGVAALQRALKIPVDGTFGPSTQRALKRWQRSHGMTPDGVVGPQTRAALRLGQGGVLKRKRARTAGDKRRGAVAAGHRRRGGGVRALQRALGLPGDGVFGGATEKALKRFQRRHGLPVDGVAGPQTRRALQMGSGPALKRKGRHHGRRHSSAGGGGGSSSVVQRVIAAANRIANKPYVYGGGHGSFDAAGYDCSGSVSYALHGGGLLSSPIDSSAFMSYGASGPGKRITIYANPGHVFMVIDGRRFDTSGRSQSGSRWGGGSRSTGGYVARHPAGY